jgi:ABC-type lipoprotein export system ATPase subunit
MANNRGSEWRKWDLHFHTPTSYDYKDSTVTNQDIIDILSQKSVSVVAITDHHIIDVQRIQELQSLGKEKGVTVLPGIEFLSESRGKEPIHFIGIFAEDCKLQYIWDQIKSKTNISKIDGEDKAYNEVYCNLLDTVKLIKELGGVSTIHAGTKSNGIDNITNSLLHATAQKEDIAEAVDIFELGKESDFEGYQSIVNQFLKNKIGKELPLIICSDNHNIREYSIKQNLWIKADPTFEGLKQIIFEPDQRVAVQSSKPEYKEEKLIIDEVVYHSTENLFPSSPIMLSPNLNVIVGGKSSGKSILLYHIAKTLETNDEVTSIANNKYNFRERDVYFDFEVKSRSGVSQKMYEDSGNSIIPNIKYIPQNYLAQLAEAKNYKKGGKLLSYVRGLLLEDDEYKQKYDEFLSRIKANDRKREGIIDNYFEIKELLSEKKKELKLQGSEEVLKKSITTNQGRVAELKKGIGLSPEKIDEYNQKKKELEEVVLDRKSIINDFREIRTFNEELLESFREQLAKKELTEKSIANDKLRADFSKKYEFLTQGIHELEGWMKNHQVKDKKFVKENTIGNLLNEINTKRVQLEKYLEPFIKDEKVKAEIAEIEKIIIRDNQKVQLINRLKKDIQFNTEELEKEKRKLFEQYTLNFTEYNNIIEELKPRTELPEENNLQIQGGVKFNADKFKKSLLNVSDGRSFPESSFTLFQEKEGLILFDQENHLRQIKTLFSNIEDGTYVISSKSNKKSVVKVLLDDYFVDYWEAIYDGDKMGEMSTGKASFVILMLIIGLSSSKAPILIDQPEDNLDNRSITKDLVTYLRIKKTERQIILVTHNPNVVVNADAENVIIAHQKGQNDKETSSIYTFDYVNGSIENTKDFDESESDLLKSMGIREHIADIVEGGKDAFKKREEKYGFR